MDNLIIISLGLMPLSMLSFVFGSSSYSSLPGVKADLRVLREEQLLMPEYDKKSGGVFQSHHRAATKLVQAANHSYWPRLDLEATSQTLFQAAECYEDIREQANSAVVELNLAILAKARLKVERELRADPMFMDELQEYVDTALSRAEWFLNKEPKRYENEVQRVCKKLKPA